MFGHGINCDIGRFTRAARQVSPIASFLILALCAFALAGCSAGNSSTGSVVPVTNTTNTTRYGIALVAVHDASGNPVSHDYSVSFNGTVISKGTTTAGKFSTAYVPVGNVTVNAGGYSVSQNVGQNDPVQFVVNLGSGSGGNVPVAETPMVTIAVSVLDNTCSTAVPNVSFRIAGGNINYVGSTNGDKRNPSAVVLPADSYGISFYRSDGTIEVRNLDAFSGTYLVRFAQNGNVCGN